MELKRHWEVQGWYIALTLLALFTWLTAIPRAAAQDYRAKITVEVKDPTGALVPNAVLTLTRVSTKDKTKAVTDAQGTFIFQLLEPDTYSLDVTAPGMAPAKVNGITVQAYGASAVPVQLVVGSQTSEVTVTDEPALLQTETASRAYSIEQKDVTDLPVINGNPIMLGQEVPGVYMRPLGVYTDPWTITSQFQINGGLMSLNEFLIDGSPNDAELGLNTYAYVLPQYAVKEFTVSANNYDAQYGRTSGGAINTTTLGGTSKINGLFWTSLRRTGWNANTSQNKYLNAATGTSNGTPLNTQTQLGFQVGGPIFIPRVIPRANKFKPFFFFAFDHYSELLPRSLILSYPTAKMRMGDFSELLTNPTGAIVIDDPATTHIDNTPGSPTLGHYIRNPFPGNIIPANRINPIAAKVTSIFPAVGTTAANQRVGTNNLSIPNNFYNWHFHNLVGRFDFAIGEKYHFFIRPSAATFDEVSNAGGIVGPGENGGTFSRASKGYLVDFVDVVNSKTVLNARFGYQFFRVKWTSPSNQGFDLTSIGYPASLPPQLQQPNFYQDYTFITGTTTNYSPIGWFDNVEDTGTYSWEGNVSRTAGAHNLRLGWDVRLTHFSFINPGYFTFNSAADFTSSDASNTTSEASSGDAFATFLLGTPSSGGSPINSTYQTSTWYLAPYVQDDWRLNSKLTMNIGLRYDLIAGPTDKHDQLNVGFDPNVPSGLPTIVGLPTSSTLSGGLQFANVNGAARSPIQTGYHNIQPRFGFAYAPFSRLSIRGGYGLYYTNYQNNNEIQQLGFSQTTPLNTTNDGVTPIPNVLNNPFPSGTIQPTGSSLGSLTAVGQAFTTFNRNFKIPSTHEFSFGVQYRVTKSSVFEAAYVGNRGRGFTVSVDENLPNWSFLQTCDELYAKGNNANCTLPVTNPFKGVAAFSGTPYFTNTSITALNLNRPHPQFGAITEGGLNRGYSWYNGLQTGYSWHMSHGISFNTSYVWAKMLNQTGWLSQSLNIPQRSVYAFQAPQVFKISGVFQLPFGRGRLFSLGGHRWADYALGGWEFSPALQVQSGEPATLPTNAIPLPHNKFLKPNWKNNVTQAWGNCVAQKTPVTGVLTYTASMAARCGSDPTTTADWAQVNVQTNEQTQPTYASFLRMKPVINSDAGIQKSFPIHDAIVATFRLQASNVLNHFNLETAKFDINPNDGTSFGTINQGTTPTTDSPPRNLNVQIRVAF